MMQEATRSWKVRTDNCTAWRSRTARESLPSPRAKAATKVDARNVKLTQNVSGAGAFATSELDCRAKSHVNGGPRKSAPRGNGVGNCQDEEQETQGNVPLSTIEWRSFEVLSDHGHTTEDIEDMDEFPEQPTETMLPPPPSSQLQKTKTRSTRSETTCRASMPDF